jgi:molybdate transport system substrate-binding protein
MRNHRARMGVAVICLAIVALLAAACGSSSRTTIRTTSASQKASGTVVVFAAASLKDAFDTIGKQFEQANPGVSVKFNYAGSSSLATQIKQAAPADVFASADTKSMDTVTNDNLGSGSPQVFARNTLEIMVAAGNPKHIKSVADLAKADVKVAVCASDVPCGAYTQEVFKKAGVTVNAVSQETSVSSVVTKVTLGEVDAGVVYTTDVKAAGDKAAGVAIPANQNVTAEYPIVELKDAPNKDGAAAFINYLLGSDGQKVLASYGFTPVGK